MTFIEVYKQAVRSDWVSPRQLFLERIAKATGTTTQVVEKWVYGKSVPRKVARQKIACELGMDENILFPTHKVVKEKEK